MQLKPAQLVARPAAVSPSYCDARRVLVCFYSFYFPNSTWFLPLTHTALETIEPRKLLHHNKAVADPDLELRG